MVLGGIWGYCPLIAIPLSTIALSRMVLSKNIAVAIRMALCCRPAASRLPPRSAPAFPQVDRGLDFWNSPSASRSFFRSFVHLLHRNIKCSVSSGSSCRQMGHRVPKLGSKKPMATSCGAQMSVPVRILVIACHPNPSLLYFRVSDWCGMDPWIPASFLHWLIIERSCRRCLSPIIFLTASMQPFSPSWANASLAYLFIHLAVLDAQVPFL